MAFISVTHGELADSHDYEKKVLKKTYYCASCRRSFVAQDEKDSCKFCLGAVEPLHNELFNKIVAQIKYHYYCEFCKKDFIVFYKPLRCSCTTPVKDAQLLGKQNIFEKIGALSPAFYALVERRREARVRAAEKTKASENKLRSITLPKFWVRSREEVPSGI